MTKKQFMHDVFPLIVGLAVIVGFVYAGYAYSDSIGELEQWREYFRWMIVQLGVIAFTVFFAMLSIKCVVESIKADRPLLAMSVVVWSVVVFLVLYFVSVM